jgi:3'-phosphoadenosine 5'-phosphosulfate sulfotransferase (PAPS reductase)/FAD synthetase
MAFRGRTGWVMSGQDALFSLSDVPGAPAPDHAELAALPVLAGYDLLLVNISGGKDSQATLDATVQAADAAGVRGRVVAVFADLGREDEWPGTAALAAEHAAHYGVRFEAVQRTVTLADGCRGPQSLLEHIEARGMWPDAARRYCTSDMKRGPILTVLTRLVRERHELGGEFPIRVLNILGLRAEESAARAAKPAFRHLGKPYSNSYRHADEWLPIHSWTAGQVWARIAQAGTRPHPVYAQGMPRLSCRFCVLASRSALIRAAQLDPDGARRRADLETRMGHRFRRDLSMAEIIAAAEATPVTATVQNWVA